MGQAQARPTLGPGLLPGTWARSAPGPGPGPVRDCAPFGSESTFLCTQGDTITMVPTCETFLKLKLPSYFLVRGLVEVRP